MPTKTDPPLLALGDAEVWMLRKALVKALPTVSARGVFTRQSADALLRRSGVRAGVKTSLATRDVCRQYCLLLRRRGDRVEAMVRGVTDLGCPVWITLDMPGSLGAPSLALDPSALFTDRDGLGLTVDGDRTAGSVRTVRVRQGGESARVQALPREECEALISAFTRDRARPAGVTFSKASMPYLRRLFLTAGITEHPSWLTMIGSAESVGTVWQGGPGVTCCLLDAPKEPMEFGVRVTPGTTRLLRWALSLAGDEEQMDSVTLDGTARGTRVEGARGDVTVSLYSSHEEVPADAPTVGESEAAAYLRSVGEAVRGASKPRTVDTNALGRALALSAGYVRDRGPAAPEGAVAVGIYGDSPDSVCALARSDRSIRVSWTGKPTAAFESTVMGRDSAEALARLLRIYASAHRRKTTPVRPVRSRSLEGLILGESPVFSFLARQKAGLRESVTRAEPTALVSEWEATTEFLQNAWRAAGAERIPQVRQYAVKNESVLGPGLGCLVMFRVGQAFLASGSLNVLARAAGPVTSGTDEACLLVPEGSLRAALGALRQVETGLKGRPEDRAVRFRLLKTAGGGLCLDLCLTDGGSEIVSARVPHAARKDRESVSELLVRNVGGTPTGPKVPWSRESAGALRRLLERVTLDAGQVALQKSPDMASLGEADVDAGVLLASDRVSALRLRTDRAARKVSLALIESLGDGQVRESHEVIWARAGGASVTARVPGLSPGAFPREKIGVILSRPEASPAAVKLGTDLGTLSAAFRESVNEDLTWLVVNPDGRFAVGPSPDAQPVAGTVKEWGPRPGRVGAAVSGRQVGRALAALAEWLEGAGESAKCVLTLSAGCVCVDGGAFRYLAMARGEELDAAAWERTFSTQD